MDNKRFKSYGWKGSQRLVVLVWLHGDSRSLMGERLGRLYLIGKRSDGKWALKNISLDGFLYHRNSAEAYARSQGYPLQFRDALPLLDWEV